MSMFVLCLATTHISYIAAFSVFSVSREVMIPISFVYANDVFREEEKEGRRNGNLWADADLFVDTTLQ